MLKISHNGKISSKQTDDVSENEPDWETKIKTKKKKLERESKSNRERKRYGIALNLILWNSVTK